MRVIIAGGRDIEDYGLLCRVVKDSGFHVVTVISGAARGVDRMGERWARENNILCARFPADWNRYGKGAGPIRNVAMSVVADALIAIRKDGSKGTQHMIETMRKLNKPTHVYWMKFGVDY